MSEKIIISELMATSGVAFGTSGARGTVAAMDDRVCYAYTKAFLQAMEQGQGISRGDEIVIAGDLRPSTPGIIAACAKAILDCGYRMDYTGLLPSPALACYAIHKGCASIMVTGSHIPDDRNGIKFNRPDGEIMKEDEQLIREQTVAMDGLYSDSGLLESVNPDADQHYKRRYQQFFPQNCLQGMKIGVYQHSGVGRDILLEVLEALGATVTALARSDTFIPVDTEAIRDEDVRLAKEWSQEGRFDAIVSTDGDADRPLITDEHGQWLRGDVVGVLCAHFLGAHDVVTPVSSNTVVEACGWFERVYRTRIGSPYVIAQMQALTVEGKIVIGYEANGGVLLGTDVEIAGRTLKALPTRDALLPILSILVAARQQGKTISELQASLPARYTASGRLKDYPSDQAKSKIAALAEDIAEIERTFSHCCGELKSTDTTDGLRMVFNNDEIIHLRPSGNAPELRCYNEAESMQRAEQLNTDCLDILSTWR